MSWLAILVAIVAIVVAFKVIGLLLRLALWGVALLALYWFAAPHLGWPTLAEVSDSNGRVLTEAVGERSAEFAGEVADATADRVVDGIAGQVRERLPGARDDAAAEADAAAATAAGATPSGAAASGDDADPTPRPLPEPAPAQDDASPARR